MYEIDKSLSYSEVLRKFVEFLNQTNSQVSTLSDAMIYLEDEGIVENINKKITDGTIGGLINTTLLGGINGQVDDITKKTDYYTIPQKFGAKGDGVNDDAPSLQSCIDSNSTNGKWTIIPKGNYKLGAPIILKDNTRIIMHKDTQLLRYHNDNIFQNGQTGDLQGKSNITIIGGKLDLRGHILNTSTSMDGTGIAFGYASNIYVSDLEIYNVYYSHGIELCAINGATIERCGFYGFILDSGGTRIMAEAIQIEKGTLTGFPYFGANDNTICQNIKIRDCKFGASSNASAWNVAVGCHGNTGNTLFADNVEIIGCVSTVPLLTKIAQFQGFKNLTFERNIFTAPHGVEIYDDGASISKVRIMNNKLTSTGYEGLYLSGVDGLNSYGNTINGYTNAVAMTGSCKNIKLISDDYYGQTSDTINGQNTCSYIVVDGVTIRKSGRHAFNFFSGCSHFKFINNMILDVADTGNAFNFAGTGTKIGYVKGNHITDAVLVNVVGATSGMDRLYFNDNIYPASIVTPINSTATNSDTTGNKTY